MDKDIMTSSLISRWARLLAAAMLAGSLLSGCGYNEFQVKDEATKAAIKQYIKN